MVFAPEMDHLAKILSEHDVPAVPPDDIDLAAEFGSDEQYRNFKRSVSRKHMSKIRDPRTVGIVVANFEKHGQRSYIGPNSFAEIAIAFAGNKRIFVLDGIPPNYADELSAWGVVDLRGDIGSIVGQFRETCLKDRKQLKLPLS